jgi:hypothetical protein
MDKEVAQALMALAVAIDEPLGRMEAVIERIEDVEIRKRFSAYSTRVESPE